MPTKRNIPTEVHYMERVRPRNCRKDRVRGNVFHADAVFKAFTEEEAPVALIVKHYDFHHPVDPENIVYECTEKPYRLANGKLYTMYSAIGDNDRLSIGAVRGDYDFEIVSQDDELFVPADIGKELSCFDDRYAWYTTISEEHMAERFHDAQRKYIMVGDALWRESSEPAYNIVGGGWGDDRWADVHIAYQPKDEREYAYNAAEWDKVTEEVQKNSARKVDFAHEDKIEVLIPEAVALPSSYEKDELNHLARAVEHMNTAVVELGATGQHMLSESVYEQLLKVEREVKSRLKSLAQRKQRGTGTLTEEQLEAATESAYNDLLNRTKLTGY